MSYVQDGSEQAAGLAASMVKAINSGNKDAVSKLANTLADVAAKQDEAAQNSNAQTVIPNVTVKTVAPAAHEGAAATVTVDGTVVNE